MLRFFWQLIVGKPRLALAGDDDDLSMAAPPENGVVKLLRNAIPYIAGLDYLVICVIVVRLVVNLFLPDMGKFLDTNMIVITQLFPTGGVIITGVVAAGLITSRLASLESDQSDISTIGDDATRKEREKFLNAQTKICREQRIQAIGFVLLYVLLVATPSVTDIDVKSTGGHIFLLVLIVGEMLVPLLNMRTFTIVEASLQKIDVVRNTMYQAQVAAMKMLKGIGGRAKRDELSRQDLRALRRGRKGDVDGMLQRHQENNTIQIAGEQYVSLRSVITGKRDGDALSEYESKRYEKALGIARRIRENDNSDEVFQGVPIKQHFTRGAHNQIFVTPAMAGQISSKLTQVRTRHRRAEKPAPPPEAQPDGE